MTTYSQFKEEIAGLFDVSETVQTIEKISASKILSLKKQNQAQEDYFKNLNDILFALSKFYTSSIHPLFKKRKKGKKILLVISSNKGLVGGMWHKITESALQNAQKYDGYIVIGSKAQEFLSEGRGNIKDKIIKKFNFEDILSLETGEILQKYLFSLFEKDKQIQSIDIIYPDFVSISKQDMKKVQFLPFDFEQNQIIKNQEKEKKQKTKNNDEAKSKIGLPIFGSSKEQIFSILIEKYIASFLYKVLLEAKLSEYSARTVEMENAYEKSKEMTSQKEKEFRKENRKKSTQRQLENFNYKK